MKRLQAPKDFKVQQVRDVLDDATLDTVKRIISELKQDQLERHEFMGFGRQVVHDHPAFSKLQRELTDTMSSLVGEAVEPGYNFLSLYNNLGVCEVHMDAPLAKWTLDICIEQSEPWPIQFSQCVPWPEQFKQTQGDWHSQIVNDPKLQFESYTLKVNQGVVFCGGNQWHYRNRISRSQERNFCHLLFLHYVPTDCEELLHPGRWHQYFEIPALSPLTDARYGFDEWAENRSSGAAGYSRK
ncbi:MAG: hypothetical protein ABJ056_09275 [Halioglobus sp.]